MVKKTLVSFVFNSPTLVPWNVVESVSEADMTEKILLWQESRREGYRYKENDAVAEVDNPTQKMKVRRILRKKVGEGADTRHQLIGLECYWWQDPQSSLPLTFATYHRAPGATEDPDLKTGFIEE